jgi:hypothetical protein
MGILDDIDNAAWDIKHGRVDWDALYKACNRECDRECISGNGEQWIKVG